VYESRKKKKITERRQESRNAKVHELWSCGEREKISSCVRVLKWKLMEKACCSYVLIKEEHGLPLRENTGSLFRKVPRPPPVIVAKEHGLQPSKNIILMVEGMSEQRKNGKANQAEIVDPTRDISSEM